MADVNAKIGVQIDTSAALAELKALQRQLANFHSSVAKGSAASAAAQKNLQYNLLNAINSTGKFYAQMGLVRTSTESFTHALEKNKLSMREYFRYAGGASRTFGKLFKQEFDTIGKVAEERVKKMSTQYIKMGRDASGAMKAMSITPTTLNMKDYGTQVALAAQKQALFNQLLKQGSTNLLNFGKNTQWAGRQLMVGFTIPLAYFGTAASKTFMDLEKQAIKFKRVYGDIFTTTEETDKALKDIQQLAQEFTKYGVAVTDTMEMAAQAAAMGKTGADLMAQVAEATRLAVLGGVEQAQALETTISVTNAFGIAADDLRKKIDFLNAVENQTVVSIEDLTVAIPKAGPVVQQLGGSVEDLAFFLTAMKEGGINASEGANALKSGLASLINPTDKASKMLAGMGVNIKAIVEGNAGNLKETVIDFAQALDTLDPLNRARAIEQLFGKFQFARLSTLFQNITKDGTQASRVLDLASASVEELAILSERELKKVEDAVGVNFKEAVEKLKVAIAPIGKIFLQTITPLVEVIGRLLDKFDNLSDGTKKFVIVAGTLIGGIGPVLLMTFGLISNAIANIIKLFVTMRTGFLRAGTTSKVLADQTQYLNSEQLEAATVAASLNQAHNRLTQSFQAETVAIQMLRQAYIDATGAAARFSAVNPGMMNPGFRGFGPKKFASGTTGVVGGTPGKDSVPSLLMPGEAVIPEAIAQDERFKPLVEALVTGKIAQYGDGTVFAHAVDKKVLSGAGVPESIKALGFNSANAFTAIGFDLSPETNSRLINRNVPVQDYLNEINKPGSTKTMTARLIDLGVDPKDAVRVTSQIRSNLANSLLGIPSGTMIGDSDIYSRMGNLKTGVLGGLVRKSRGGLFGQAIRSLYSPTAYSPRGLSTIKMNSNVPVSQVIEAVKKTRTSQSAISALRRVQELDPNYRMPVKLDSAGNIVAFERPEISKRTGEISNTRVIGALQGNRFTTARLSRGGGRKITPSRGAMEMATQLLVGRGEIVQTKDGRMQMVTSTTGKPKASRSNVFGGGISDKRSLPLTTVRRVIPRFRGMALGAEDGYPPVAGGKSFSQTASGLLVPQSALVNALEKNSEAVDNGTKTQTQSSKTQKEIIKEQRQARADRIGRVAGPLSMVAGTAAMAGYATGNAGMGNIAMGISGLAMVAPMLANPLGATAAALTAMTAAVVLTRKAFDKAQDSAMEMAEAMGSGDKAIQDLAMFAGRVSAGEIMDRRRSNILNPFAVQTGKTTFGENFVKSETGKAMVSSVTQSIKTGGSQAAQGQILNQLATGIASGAIDPAQARSIAANIASEIGDYSFGINVNAKLIELFGVNGENLMKDPLRLRVVLMEESRKDLQKQSQSLSNVAPGAMTQTQLKVGAIGYGAAGAVAGGILGATAAGATAGSVVPVVGTAIGAAIGATIAAGALWFSQKGQQEKLGRASGANVAMQKMALEQSQQMQDSLKLEYEKRIANAKAAGDIAKAVQLQGEYEKANAELLAQNGKLVTDIQNSYKGASGAVRGALETGLDKQITAKYKGTAMADIAPLATDLLGGSALSKEQQFTIKMQLASGQMDPMQIVNLMETFGKDSKTLTKVMNIVTKFGGAFAGQAMSVADLFKDKKGNPLKEQQTKFIADISTKTSEEAEKYLKLFAEISRVGNVMDVEVALTYYSNNPLAAAQLQSTIDKINEQKGKITLDVATKILGAKEMEALRKDQEYFSSLPAEQQKVYLQTLTTIANIQGTNAEAIKNWLTQNPGKTEADYYIESAQKLTKVSVDNTIPTGATDSQDTGKRDTTFDDILINLKRTRDATIDATGGAKELIRVLGGTKDITIFKGLDQQLARLGANTDFIEFAGGVEKAIQNKIIRVSKDGVASLTELGKAAMKAYNEKQLGLYQAGQINAAKGAIAQREAFVKLKAAGASSAEALELVADAQLAISINSQRSAKDVDLLVKSLRNAKKESDKTFRANDPVSALEEDIQNINTMFDLYERQARAKYEPQIDRVNKLIDAAQERVDDLQRKAELEYDRPIQKLQEQTSALNHDLTLISQATDKINEKYDKQREALEKVYAINERIAQQQKSKIALADALTQGDISAAAQAMADMRSEAQGYAQEDSLTALETARQNEINALTSSTGMTKVQIEQKLFDISEEIYALETKRQTVDAEILKLQDEIYNLQNNQLKVAEKALAAELEAIDAQRQKWNNVQLAIDFARANAAGYNQLLLDAEATLTRMLALWASMGSGITMGAIEGALGGAPVEVTSFGGETKTGSSGTTKKTNNPSGTGKKGAAASGGFKTATAYRSYRSGERGDTGITTSSAMASGYTNAKTYQSFRAGERMYGGLIKKYNVGGIIAGAGMTDKVPALLTPGEYVVNRAATQKFGPLLEQINESKYPGSLSLGGTPSISAVNNNMVNNNSTSVYNYSLDVNVSGTNANPDDIARTVIAQIRSMDAQRLRGNRY
jgi:TP901 family phage tail tape measure protein